MIDRELAGDWLQIMTESILLSLWDGLTGQSVATRTRARQDAAR
jgi:hypothetical protein